MFTGIIQAVGKIESVEKISGDLRVKIDADRLDLATLRCGDSIAVDGVCLTVTGLNQSVFWADISVETMRCTTFASASAGMAVNLEKSLTVGASISGHLVSGHVDGIGQVLLREDHGRSVLFRIEAPESLAPFIAYKGSICVDGVSLTVNAIENAVFDLNIVSHTLQATTMARYQPGTTVNLEIDLVARYVERLLHFTGETGSASQSSISRDFLLKRGF